ncbi:MAG: Hpt domain-containing protein [Pseudomonadota bacterium]|nr:Hpt domain-containing protein [Pseudomonadota bacterium]
MAEAAAAPDESSWLDWPRALAIVDGDVPLLEHLIDVFLTQYRQTTAHLREAVHQDDWTLVRRLAHQLAGSAGAIGAVELERLARAADAAVRAVIEGPVSADLREQSLVAVGALVNRLEWTLTRAASWRGGAETGG